jgi:hypothetical protein
MNKKKKKKNNNNSASFIGNSLFTSWKTYASEKRKIFFSLLANPIVFNELNQGRSKTLKTGWGALRV